MTAACSPNGLCLLEDHLHARTTTHGERKSALYVCVAAPELSAFSPPPSVKVRVGAATSTWEKRITNQEKSWESCLLAALLTAVFLGLRFTQALYTITTFLFLTLNPEKVGGEESPQILTFFAGNYFQQLHGRMKP